MKNIRFDLIFFLRSHISVLFLTKVARIPKSQVNWVHMLLRDHNALSVSVLTVKLSEVEIIEHHNSTLWFSLSLSRLSGLFIPGNCFSFQVDQVKRCRPGGISCESVDWDQSPALWRYPALSLVELLHYCALIGWELQSVEIFSWCCYAINNQLLAGSLWHKDSWLPCKERIYYSGARPLRMLELQVESEGREMYHGLSGWLWGEVRLMEIFTLNYPSAAHQHHSGGSQHHTIILNSQARHFDSLTVWHNI